MTDAETIADLRAQLAERDAEIRGLRGMLGVGLLDAKRIAAGISDKPRRVSESFPAFLEAMRKQSPHD
jgi:hypothetical protein